MPLISVIIPVYNVSEYIDRCLKSVVSQTYHNIEIILVDDGARDDSGKKCDDWGIRDKRISVIHKENGGLSSARNAGLKIVQGQYIMFVDSDDVISSNIIERLYSCCNKYNADLAICDVVHIFSSTETEFSTGNKIIEYTPENAILEIWYQSSFLPSAWGKLYKKKLFENRGFTQGLVFEDIDIMHEVFWDAEKVVYCDDKLYGYVHRDDSITTKKFSRKDLDILNVTKKILLFSEDKTDDLKEAAQAYATVAALRVYLNAPKDSDKDYKEGINTAIYYLETYGKSVLKDSNIRKKHRYALLLYFYCRPIIRIVYKKVNRWK